MSRNMFWVHSYLHDYVLSAFLSARLCFKCGHICMIIFLVRSYLHDFVLSAVLYARLCFESTHICKIIYWSIVLSARLYLGICNLNVYNCISKVMFCGCGIPIFVYYDKLNVRRLPICFNYYNESMFGLFFWVKTHVGHKSFRLTCYF